MAVDVAQMSDAEICNLRRGHSLVTPTPPTGIQTKFNPNPCFQCGLHDPNPEEKHFIASPADKDTHREND